MRLLRIEHLAARQRRKAEGEVKTEPSFYPILKTPLKSLSTKTSSLTGGEK
jgi:hypothetical protein